MRQSSAHFGYFLFQMIDKYCKRGIRVNGFQQKLRPVSDFSHTSGMPLILSFSDIRKYGPATATPIPSSTYRNRDSTESPDDAFWFNIEFSQDFYNRFINPVLGIGRG
jgi:hypothetical protein